MSLRVKLTMMVLTVAILGIAAVIVSSLSIVRESQKSSIQVVNRQLSDLVSRSVLHQLSEYRFKLEYLKSAWEANPNIQVDANLFPDFVWVQFLDAQGNTKFEWYQEASLTDAGLNYEMLIGRKKSQDLALEVKHQHLEFKRWIVLNSTIQTLFPTFLLGVAFQRDGASDPDVIGLVEINARKLYSSIQSRANQELMIIDSNKNILLSTREKWDPSQIVLQDEKVLSLLSDLKEGQSRFETLEYSNRDPQASSLHKFREGGELTIVLQEPLSQVELSQNLIFYRSLIIAAIVLLIMLNLLFFFASSITRPLGSLASLMEKVGKGQFSGKIKIKSRDEIGVLAKMFNKMIEDLNARDQEIESAKSKLIQSEKMSAFGQMSAGIAHEVKNPLAGILGYAQMGKKKLPPESEVQNYLEIIEKETIRCKEIVENLMKFARQEKAQFSKIDINKTVKDSIRLVEHQMSISGIKLVQALANDGAAIFINGNTNQIQQVMMNLMLNAQQAMPNKGSLTITSHFDASKKNVFVTVADTGEGMSDEVKARIFEPFFTTKGVGRGTGLGLAVSLGIIKDHNGTIEVESVKGKGTTFTMTFPCHPDQSIPEGSAEQSAA